MTYRTVNLRMAIYRRLRKLADAEDRTIGAQIKVLLDRAFPQKQARRLAREAVR